MRSFFPLLFVLGCAARVPEPPARAAATAPVDADQPAPAPAVVVLSVDQLASWVFEARRSSLAPDGGFAKLARDGTYWSDLRYEHATTSTAPGHAAIAGSIAARASGAPLSTT